MIAAYVSGHGFGHSTRTAEVLREVRARDASVAITVVCSAKTEHLYRRAVPERLDFRGEDNDVGLAQKSALVIDEAGTVDAWRRFHPGYDDRVAREARWLRETRRPRRARGHPAAGLRRRRGGRRAVDRARQLLLGLDLPASRGAQPGACTRPPTTRRAAYGRCGLLLELPFAGDLSAFPRRDRIPLVARRPRVGRAETRRRLGLDGTVVAVVVRRPRAARVRPARARADARGHASWSATTARAARQRTPGVRTTDMDAARTRVRRPRRRRRRRGHQARLRDRVRRDRRPDPDALHRPRRLPGVPDHGPRDGGVAARGIRDQRRSCWAAAWRTRSTRLLARPMPPGPDIDGAGVAARRILAAASW